MNGYLGNEDLMNSFDAIKCFLQSGKYRPLLYCQIKCRVILSSRQTFIDDFEFECIEHIPSYKIHSPYFDSIGLRSFWSAYNLFEWNIQDETLIFSINNTTIKIRHNK